MNALGGRRPGAGPPPGPEHAPSGTAIAVVGMACRYPDARSASELWENVLAQRRAFRRLPPERLRLDDYYAADPSIPDTMYATEAAVIEGYTFDRVRFRVVGSTYRSADIAHWLALDIAAAALDDAGFAEGAGLPRETTGVLIGNSLTGDLTRAQSLRLRWPYVRRVTEAALAEQGWSAPERRAFLDRLEARYKAPFAPVGEETLAGGLSNTIAGRICNAFDLNGGGYTVDGACSSSLLALATACTGLVAGDLDVALAGGVDVSLDPFELVGFAKTGALAPEEMRVYDARAAGFWPGEGAGVVVLMRLADAIATGRRIHAVVRGWGISSDGSGGLTRPEVEGQLLALRRAYDRAGYGPDSVSLFEGHGTGTAVGDATELQVLSRARREAGATDRAAIGSIKANIGHTKAAAGAAGFLKAVLAAREGIIPPATGVGLLHPELEKPDARVRLPLEGEAWPANRPRRVGVSSMGFGGINVHVTLDADPDRGARATARHVLDPTSSTLLRSAQDAELFCFTATDPVRLRQVIAPVLERAPWLARSEMADLAAALAGGPTPGAMRAAVVAARPADLARALSVLAGWLEEAAGDEAKPGETGTLGLRIDARHGVVLGTGTREPAIGFLFPGQGSPSHRSGGALRRRFAVAHAIYAQAGAEIPDGDEMWTAVAQPAIVTASIAAARVLATLGVDATVALGHSLGELTALAYGGVFSDERLTRIARARGEAMAQAAAADGAMASLGAGAEVATELIQGEPVVIAGYNAADRTVISGPLAAIERVMERARNRQVGATRLAVSHAFHSPMMAPVRERLAAHLAGERCAPLARSIVSTVTGAPLDGHADIKALLEQQLTEPVRFTAALAAAGPVDLWIEVGPGEALSTLARSSTDRPIVATDAGGQSLRGILMAAGAAFAAGAHRVPAALFTDRFTRPFDLARTPSFFRSPCEEAPALPAAPAGAAETAARIAPPEMEADSAPAAATKHDATHILALIRQLVAERVELPESAVSESHHLLQDLHLNSITVGQLVVEAARRLGLAPPVAPSEFATATVGEIAQALATPADTGERSPDPAAAETFVPGIGSWVRPFAVEWIERPLATGRDAAIVPNIEVLAVAGDPLAARLRALAGSDHVQGGDTDRRGDNARTAPASPPTIVVCLPRDPGSPLLELLLASARRVREKGSRYILVQQGADASAFAQTLHLERNLGATAVVSLVAADDPAAAKRVLAEIAALRAGFTAVAYNGDGRRQVPLLRVLPDRGDRIGPATPAPGVPLGASDVLLVTGGGKGIAAECAFAIARATGAALALLGRSAPDTDRELATNLERIAAAGVRCHYRRADVTVPEETRDAIAALTAALGPVTAVLHGAGSNVPRLAGELDLATVLATIAPKVEGLANVLGAVDPGHLRLLVTFGSIIARIGMPGEADYALANAWLRDATQRFATAHPGCRCHCLEWSAWSGVGMAERLGRIESLVRRGVTPITPEDGAGALLDLLGRENAPVAVVLSGRFGEPGTIELDRPELPLYRFLEHPRVHVPGVELIADAELSEATDPYLGDHVLDGLHVFPAVLGLEAMAQAAMALVGSTRPPRFDAVSFSRPIPVAPGAKVMIRLCALVEAPGRVQVAIRTADSAFQVDHFRAQCVFGTKASDPLPMRDPGAAGHEDGANPVPLDPDRDLYAGLLFQRGRFRRLRRYSRLSARACRAELARNGSAGWFGDYHPATLVLGDPGVRDAALHAIQACIPHARILPIGVDAIHTTAWTGPGSDLSLHARERRRDGDLFIYDLEMSEAGGTIVERWAGVHLRSIGTAPVPAAWPLPLFGPYLERRIEEIVPGAAIRVAIETSGNAGNGNADAAIRRAAGLERHVVIERRPDGKPELASGPAVSAAHSGRLLLAVAGPGPLACDAEAATPRDSAIWAGLLGTRAALAASVVKESGEDLERASTRVWTAIECLKKAGLPITAPLSVDRVAPDGWVVFRSGSLVLASCAAQVEDGIAPLVVTLLCASPAAGVEALAT